MYIEYGGVSIGSLITQHKLIPNLKPILQGLKGMSNLFLKMSKQGITHGDVHEGNILFDKTTDRIYLIDYTMIQSTKGMGLVEDMVRLIDLIQLVLSEVQIRSDVICSDMINRFNTTAKKVKSSLDIQIMYTFINDFIPSVISYCSKDGVLTRTSSEGNSSIGSPARLSPASATGAPAGARRHRKTRRRLRSN